MHYDQRSKNIKLELSYNYGINAVISIIPSCLYETARIRTNSNVYFIEELNAKYNKTIDLFKQELNQKKVKFKYFDRLICLVKAMIDKEFIIVYNVTDCCLNDLNERVILETVLAFMSFSKWHFKGNEIVQFDLFELYKNHENILGNYKKQLLKYIKIRDYDAINMILKNIYFDGIALYYDLDKDKVKNVSVLLSDNSPMEITSNNTFNQKKIEFRKSFLRNNISTKPKQNRDFD